MNVPLQLHYAPLLVVCDKKQRGCGSQRGEYCHSRTGYNVPFHKPRRDAVASMSEEEKRAGLRVLVAERAAAKLRNRGADVVAFPQRTTES